MSKLDARIVRLPDHAEARWRKNKDTNLTENILTDFTQYTLGNFRKFYYHNAY
jgi:hypothetical protein